MSPHTDPPTHAPLAAVIQLQRGVRRADCGVSPEPGLTHPVELLERRCGIRWAELPTSLGRTAARAEEMLVRGPTSIDPSSPPVDVARRAASLVEAAVALAVLVAEEADVLGEGLGSGLVDLPLDQLDELVGAVRDLALATCLEPSWSAPAAAAAADTVLTALEPELRAATQLHAGLYARFTDQVLELDDAQLRAGERPWRLVARARLRRRLASASRTGRLPDDLRTVARDVLAVRASRRRLATLAPLLSTHLERTGWGPLNDVDAVVGSLAAVRRFQSALGERLAPDRFARLLTARAFASPEVSQPAANLRAAIDRWREDVVAAGGDPSWASSGPELAAWAASTRAVLPAITSGAAAMSAIDRVPPTLRALVDSLLLRERVSEASDRLSESDRERGRSRRVAPGSAS